MCQHNKAVFKVLEFQTNFSIFSQERGLGEGPLSCSWGRQNRQSFPYNLFESRIFSSIFSGKLVCNSFFVYSRKKNFKFSFDSFGQPRLLLYAPKSCLECRLEIINVISHILLFLLHRGFNCIFITKMKIITFNHAFIFSSTNALNFADEFIIVAHFIFSGKSLNRRFSSM